MKIQVAAAILKDDSLTLVTVTGEYHKIPQGDARLRPILDLVLPIVQKGETIEVDLASITQNHYQDFEKKTNGAVRFFRVLKNKLKGWFGDNSITTADGTYGHIPDSPSKVNQAAAAAAQLTENRQQTLKEIVESAEPITGMVFNDSKQNDVQLKPDETLIAVVDNESIVPNAQNLLPQIARANGIGSTVGMENFMRRTAKLERQHSQEDLIQFIGKSDLQVADDGCILGWKNLSATNDPNVYVDPYTKKVRQWIGSLVFMAEKLVDPNRGQDCSNGLHVASRSYLGGYSGSGGTFLIKIRPEDVIAVPKYNTNKMRVCAYHILGKLSPQDTSLMLDNKPLASEEGRRLLAHAVNGTHIEVTHKTEITEGHGGGCIYTTVVDDACPALNEEAVEKSVVLEDVAPVAPVDYENPDAAETVDPNEIAEEVAELRSGKPTRREQAQLLYTSWEEAGFDLESQAYAELVAFKKATKTSWEKLGLPSSPNGNVLPRVQPVEAQPVEEAQEAPVEAAVADETSDATEGAVSTNLSAEELYERYLDSSAESDDERKYAELLIAVHENNPDDFFEVCDEADLVIFRDLAVNTTETEEKPVETPKATGKLTPSGEKKSYRDQLQDLLKDETSLSLKSPSKARSALSIKQASKKGWSVLGVDEKLAKRIVELAK